jgi:ABC-type antimicrobial peptide transport system permease subunit
MNYLLKELHRHLWRTVASISGYIIAALFILLVLSVNRTNEMNSFGILKGTGTHFMVFIPSQTACCVSCNGPTQNGSVFAEGVYTQMLNKDVINSVKKIRGVRDAAPYLLYKMYDEKFGIEISLGGIDTGNIATKNNVCAATNLIAGMFISDNPNELVAEESFAMGHKLYVGDSLNIFGGRMVLTGIINSGIKPGKADFYSSIQNVRSILKNNLKCQETGFDMNVILVEVNDARIQNQVISQLKKNMSYLTVSSYNCYEPASKVMTIIEKTSTILSIIIFIFLIVFSTKTQLTALMERFREIGILKSLGWSNLRLSNQILVTSLIQSVIGVSIGSLMGALIILLLNRYNVRLFDLMEFHFPYNSLPLLIILSFMGGIIACIFPVIKLYRTKAGDMINNYL